MNCILREPGHGAVADCDFTWLPRVGDWISLHQTAKAVYFEVTAVEHVVQQPQRPAGVILNVKRIPTEVAVARAKAIEQPG